MSEHRPDICEPYSLGNINAESYKRFRVVAKKILNDANFLLFPVEKTVTIWEDEMVTSCLYKCDLIVEDKNFSQGIQKCQVLIDWQTLLNFDSLKSFLQLQIPTVSINEMTRKEKDAFCENVRLWLLTGYELLFWINTVNNVPRLGFDSKDKSKFIFSNWILDIHTWKFTKWEYNLTQNTSINLTYHPGDSENLTLEQSLKDILSLKNYISSDNTISSVFIGYLINGIFRNEYKEKHNEYPFLWIETHSWMGKTSLLNFISQVTGFNRDNIPWTNDTDFAFEVWMNGISWWYYFLDEIQKANPKLLKFLQAAYNSGENRKWGWEWNWRQLQVYRKDCNLICTGELLPQSEEALLNRFVIINPKEDFLIKKMVTFEEEHKKFKEITGTDAKLEYLDTGEIKILAVNYYRPRFLNILKNKEHIDYEKYHLRALELIDDVVKERKELAPDTRLRNNFAATLTGYLILCGDDVDENEIRNIITEYFKNLQEYRNSAIVPWQIVDYIIEKKWYFCSWMDKITSGKSNPMIYLKHTEKQKGLLIQISWIVRTCKDKLNLEQRPKHIEQQLRKFLDCSNTRPSNTNVAKWQFKIEGVFISLEKITACEPLQRLWDCVLEYTWEHQKELERVQKDNSHITMDDTILAKLIQEMDDSYSSAEFFDKVNYSKDNTEESMPF